jgi:Domain of unknown function (DUF4157)
MDTHSKNRPEKSSQPKQEQNPLGLKKQDNFFSGNFFQASLEIGSPDDPYEQEADMVSQQVTQQYDMLSGIGSNMSADALQTMLIQPMLSASRISRRMQRRLQKAPLFVQAKCAECEKEEEGTIQSSRVQRSGNGNIASADIESRVYESQGKGQQMDAGTKAMMETSFGADFSNVRIHTNSQSVQMSRDLGAHAFTVGNDIHFNNGKYQPGSKEGISLLSHELTHVVQQGAAAQTKLISKDAEEERLPEGVSCPVMDKEEQTLTRNFAKQNASLFRKEISKFTTAHAKNDILSKQSILQKTGIGKINLKDNSKTLRRCSGCGGGGTPAPAATTKAKLKSGPTYAPNGALTAVKAADGKKYSPNFTLNAEFENDPANGILARCGEIRQFVRWSSDADRPNHSGFSSTDPANTWIEDRGAGDTLRLGHRTGTWAVATSAGSINKFLDSTGAVDMANGAKYEGSDRPMDGSGAKTGHWDFEFRAIDICNGDQLLGTDSLTVQW